MDVGNMRNSFLAGHTARNFTLLVFLCIPLGNLLCELGNLLAMWLGLDVHYFNKFFLVIGVFGMLGFGYALFRRRGICNKASMVRIAKREREK